MKPSHLILISLLTIALLVVGVQATTVKFNTSTALGTAINSSENPTYPAVNAFDNNIATFFSTNVDTLPAWIGIDFNATTTHKVLAYNLTSRQSNPTYAPAEFTFEGTNDITNNPWVVIDHPSGLSWTDNQKIFTAMSSAGNESQFRYYRINRIGADYLQLAEIELWGDDTPAPIVPVASFTTTNISVATNTTSQGWAGVAPFTMQFTNTSTNPPHTSWVWNYTALGSSTPVTFNSTAYYNPIYAFTGAGNYTIKLNVTGTYGTNISTQATWVNVSKVLPTFSSVNNSVATKIVAGGYEGVAPFTMTFTNTTILGAPRLSDFYIYKWNYTELTLSLPTTFNTSTAYPPQQTFVAVGNYSISLDVLSAYDTSVSTQVMWINTTQGIEQPLASFTQDKVSGDAPLAVAFTDTSTVRPMFWNWSVNASDWSSRDWYNYTTSTNLNYNFLDPGIYNVTLTVSNSSAVGSIPNTFARDVLVNATLQADFVGAPLSGYASTDVSFVDFSTGAGIYSWAWTFGDGGTSTERNPTHTYSTVGTFDVGLTVMGADGTSVKTEVGYITMGLAPNPDTASTLSFQSGFPIITNLTGYTRTVQISNVVNASWINGTTLFDTDHIRIERVLANTSTFVSNTVPSYSINNATGTITFNATNTSGFIAGTTPLSFLDIEMLYDRYSTGSTSAAWGSGSIGNSTYKGQFPVATLTDTPLAYSWTTHSNFTISDDTPTSGDTVVSLTPSDHPEAADRFLWNFGDGTSFLDHNGTVVTHVYTVVGSPPLPTYSTSLTAYLSANTSVTNTTAKTISPVYPAEWVKANFTATQTNVGAAEIVYFIDSSEFGNSTATKVYNWSFGDGTFSNTVGNVNHVYAYYSVYTVRLNVSNIDPTLGNSSLTRADYIQVSTDNVGNKLNVLYPHEVQFSLVDTIGNPLSDVDVAIVMSNSTVGNTNWFTTLFGISTDATPVDTTVLTGTSDDDGSITFPLLSSGRYTMSFNSTMRGISETKTVYPQQANYVIVLHPNANLIPNRNDYINGTLYVTTPNESYADLRLSYTDLSTSTASISFYVDYSNHTRFDTQTFTGVYNITAYKSIPNVKATSYVFGYYANSSMFGNVSASQGIMMKGVAGKLINLDPCGGYARGWGNQC